jgi:nucleoside 2-deoxyribosyltransferase
MSEPVDPFTGAGWDAYAADVRDNLVPRIDDSAIVASLVPDDLVGDVKYAVELGYSIMLDKPIVLIVGDRRTADRLPRKLRLVADRIVVADLTTTAGQETIADALHDLSRDGLDSPVQKDEPA